MLASNYCIKSTFNKSTNALPVKKTGVQKKKIMLEFGISIILVHNII